MFTPVRCPNLNCENHKDPQGKFFRRRGYYHPKCRAYAVPRFRCNKCRRGFSRQTFRADYRDHRPDLNTRVFGLLASGMGLRQAARILAISRGCLASKARKIGRQLRGVNSNLARGLGGPAVFELDEMISFEQNRRTRPITIPILIERKSMFVVGARSATIPPSGKMTIRRLAAIRKDKERFGRRRDQSKWCVRRVLKEGAKLFEHATAVKLVCDKKPTYRGIALQVFGPETVVQQHSGKAVRNTSNPLFRINLTNAMARDLNGRLRRRSWLATKKRRFLDLQLEVFKSWRNYHRPRFNDEHQTPAQILGLVNRRLSLGDLLSWRQDWGGLSKKID